MVFPGELPEDEPEQKASGISLPASPPCIVSRWQSQLLHLVMLVYMIPEISVEAHQGWTGLESDSSTAC